MSDEIFDPIWFFNFMKSLKNKLFYFHLCLVLTLCHSIGYAQQSKEDAEDAELIAEQLKATQLQVNQLNDLVESLNAKREARETLRETIASAEADDIPDVQEDLDELNQNIRETNLAFEQIAIGSVDLDIFSETESELNWRTELAQVLMPLMQNLKRITEKPRRIEILNAKISQLSVQKLNADVASSNITSVLETVKNPDTVETLNILQADWQEQSNEFNREIDLANVQLSNLQRSGGPIWIRVRDGFINFFKGRGLTLLLSAAAVMVVHYAARLVSKLFSKKQKGEDVSAFRTRERIAHYGLKAIKTTLMLVAVIFVFYLRGDILLMGVAFIVAAGIVLSLRNTIPKFIDELRLLLNLGSIREDERVMYQGLPWKVTKLNMYSLLKNPEITGVLRIPMQEMIGLTSRPAGKEPWFPASKGEYVVFDDNRLLQVTKITPEHVLLTNLAGTKTMISTVEFYSMVFENLSRSDTYFVSTVFGIGYSHQGESVSEIPEKLKSALERKLADSDLADSVVSVSAELQEAGASSLDFWVGVMMKSDAATSYFKIKRTMQQVCVATCTQEQWDIPFPQLTLHNS